MRKNRGFIVLIVIIILQLCIPVGMIVYKTTENTRTEENGVLCRFEISSMTYKDGELEFDIDIATYDDPGKNYAEIETNISGNAQLTLTDEQPDDPFYIKSSDKYAFDFPLSVYKTEKYENLERIYLSKKTDDDSLFTFSNHYRYNSAYLEAYVYNGSVSIVNIYIDGVEADEYLRRIAENE